MANFFPQWTNWIPLNVGICVDVVGAAVAGWVWYYFTPKYTRLGYMPTQPVPFSHAVHVKRLALDCWYSHSCAEAASHSNIPTTQTCMACHAQIQATSPKLEAVSESWNPARGRTARRVACRFPSPRP